MLNEETNLKKNSRMQQQMAAASSSANQTPSPSIMFPSPAAASSQTNNAQMLHAHPHLLNPMAMLSQMGAGHHLPQIIQPPNSSSSSSSRPGPIPSPLQQQQQQQHHLLSAAGGSTPKSNPSPFNHMPHMENNGNGCVNKPNSPFHPPQPPPMPHPLSSPSPNQPNCMSLFINITTLNMILYI